MVGMLITEYFEAVAGFSSTFSLATFALHSNSRATSYRMGFCIWQGPHHTAQKSTKTGMGDLTTSVSKLLSVTAISAIFYSREYFLSQTWDYILLNPPLK